MIFPAIVQVREEIVVKRIDRPLDELSRRLARRAELEIVYPNVERSLCMGLLTVSKVLSGIPLTS
jgi:hypothetical protein